MALCVREWICSSLSVHVHACVFARMHACVRACVDGVCFVGKGAKACVIKAGDLGQSAAETAELSSKLRGMSKVKLTKTHLSMPA